MQTLIPAAVVSFGQATLTWTRQALAVKTERAAASALNIIFNFILLSYLLLPKPLAPKRHQATSWNAEERLIEMSITPGKNSVENIQVRTYTDRMYVVTRTTKDPWTL